MGTFSGQIQGIDLPSIYAAAQQYRMREQQMQAQKDEGERQNQLRALYGDFLGGNVESGQALMRAAPDVYQDAARKQQELQINQLRQRQAEEDQRAQVVQRVGGMIGQWQRLPDATRPLAWPSVRAEASRLGVNDLPEMPEAGVIDNYVRTSLALQPQRPMARETDPEIYRVWEKVEGWKPPGQQRPFNMDWVLAYRQSGATRIGGGTDGSPLTMAGITQQQEGVFSDQKLLAQLDHLDSFDEGKLLRVTQRLADAGKSAAAYLIDIPEDWADDLAEREDFEETVNGIFNTYRKEITGSGAAITELRDLRRSILNTDMNAPRFSSAKARLRQITRWSLAAREQTLREGVQYGTDAYRKRFNEHYMEREAQEQQQQQDMPPGAPTQGLRGDYDQQWANPERLRYAIKGLPEPLKRDPQQLAEWMRKMKVDPKSAADILREMGLAQ